MLDFKPEILLILGTVGVRTESSDGEPLPVRRRIPIRFFCDLIDGTNFDGVKVNEAVLFDCDISSICGVLRPFICWVDSVSFVSENDSIHSTFH